MLYFADIVSFDDELHSEMEKVVLFDELPTEWTYPLIQPLLIEEYKKRKNSISVIGKIVHAVVDRPLGSYHPEHRDMYYPVNYGYVEGIMAPDGEEQDVYILGVDEPITEFTGKVIAIIHRYNDIEEKWVVAPEGKTFTVDEIKEKVDFTEKFFESDIIV